jgi:hypothetical protein
MLELIGFSLLVLVGLAALVFGVVVLPLLILGAFVKALLFVVLLPLRLFGWLLGAIGAVAFGLLKAALFVLGLLAGAFVLVGGLLVLPLLPVLVLGLVIWALARLLRPRPVVGASA